MSLCLSVPEELARELTIEGLAAIPLATRADPAVPLTVITVLGLASDMATIVVALPTVSEFVRGLVHAGRRRREAGVVGALTIRVTTPDGSSTAVEVTDLGEDYAMTLIASALLATTSSWPGP